MIVSQVNSTGYIKKTERQHTFHIGIASWSTRYCWKWRLVKFISCPKTMIELYQIYFSIATLGPAKTSYARPRSRKKEINLCHVVFLYKLFNNGSTELLSIIFAYVLVNWFSLIFLNLYCKWGITVVCNKIRKTLSERLKIVCRNLNCLLKI